MAVAQEEGLNIEGLAEKVANLVGRVDTLESRFLPGPYVDDEGNCRLAMQNDLHTSTLASYQVLFQSGIPDYVSVEKVEMLATSEIAVTFGVGWDDIYVIEFWDGCNFSSRSLFWEEDYSGEKTYIDEEE